VRKIIRDDPFVILQVKSYSRRTDQEAETTVTDERKTKPEASGSN
jgi:hypothetical protein